MKQIDISTKSYPNRFCIIDDMDYDWVRLFKWSPEEHGHFFYAVRSAKNTVGSRYLVRLHRDIVRARSFEQVDHKNSNGLDNRRCNLRIVSNMKNQQNRVKRSNLKSRFKGVFPRKNKVLPTTWFAYITVNKKRFSLGTFYDDITAAKEYDSKALYHFGPFARLNFPIEETTSSPIKGYEDWKSF